MNLRPAIVEDVKNIVLLGSTMHQEGIYKSFPYDLQKCAVMAMEYIRNPNKLLLVALNEDSQMVGMFFGYMTQHYFGPTVIAVEQLLYIVVNSRGGRLAFRIMKAFEKWAVAQGAQSLVFGQSNNGANDKWDTFCSRLGYSKIGATYMKGI